MLFIACYSVCVCHCCLWLLLFVSVCVCVWWWWWFFVVVVCVCVFLFVVVCFVLFLFVVVVGCVWVCFFLGGGVLFVSLFCIGGFLPWILGIAQEQSLSQKCGISPHEY